MINREGTQNECSFIFIKPIKGEKDDMDEMKITSSWARNLVSKAITKSLKKAGIDATISFDNLYITIDDKIAHINMCAKADVPKELFDEFIDKI